MVKKNQVAWLCANLIRPPVASLTGCYDVVFISSSKKLKRYRYILPQYAMCTPGVAFASYSCSTVQKEEGSVLLMH